MEYVYVVTWRVDSFMYDDILPRQIFGVYKDFDSADYHVRQWSTEYMERSYFDAGTARIKHRTTFNGYDRLTSAGGVQVYSEHTTFVGKRNGNEIDCLLEIRITECPCQ